MIRTTVVGSYPVPGGLTEASLDGALTSLLRKQEDCGIDVITDGELLRFDPSHPETNGMIETFVVPLDGVATDMTDAEAATFAARAGVTFRRRPPGIVRQPIGRGSLDLATAWHHAQDLTEHPVKLTLTSPYMLAKTLMDAHYGDLSALTFAIADALADAVREVPASVVQVDEANLTGHPEDAPWAVETMNRVLDAASGERGVHLCFGNYGGKTIQEGFWRDLVPHLDALHADHLILETARRDPAELEQLRPLRDDLGLGIGVIDIKDARVETPGEVADRIASAVTVLGADRVRWVHPDCGFWMLTPEVADAKMGALGEGRDLYLGRAGGG